MKSLGRRGNRMRWLLILVLGCAAAPAFAQSVVVSNTNDSGPGSLRQAMLTAQANPAAGFISFATNGVITLLSPLPPLLSSGGALTITGNGAANTVIDGAGQHRPFKAEWQDGLNFTLRSLTVRNGFADLMQGGAIFFIGGAASRVTIDAVEFVDNRATYDGGAIFSEVPVRIDASVFAGNDSVTFGGAIFTNGSALHASNSTFTGNKAASGVILIAGNAVDGPASRLVNLTVTGNWAHSGVLEIRNRAKVSLSNSLITDNTYDAFAGRDVGGADYQGQIDLVTSLNNVIGKNDLGIQNGVSGNQVGVTLPLVGPLGAYGGPTRTVPLLPGSPALNAGTSAGGDIPLQDQRGIVRVGAVDVGAFESRGFSLTRIGGSPQSTPVNSVFAAPLTVEVAAAVTVEPVENGRVKFSVPASGASATLATPDAAIGADGRASSTATANATVGTYTVTAALSAQTTDFSLANTPDQCAGFAFPYTLSGTDNAARVVELRQAIECANGNGTGDVINLGAHTLVFGDGPYSNANGASALPLVTSAIELRNGAFERDASSPGFRFLAVTDTGTLTVQSMRLRGGLASDEGGAILALGPLTLRDSVFENNSAPARGGAVSAHKTLNALTSRFTGNVALEGAAVAGDDMLMLVNARVEDNGDGGSQSVVWGDFYGAIINSLFAGNQLSAAGSSLMVFTDNALVAEMRNVTIADNSVAGVLLRRTDGFQIRNSIIWNNQFANLGMVSPRHSILPGVPHGAGNFDVEPGFAGAPGDYRLAAGSPAIDAGDNDFGFPDFYDIDDDGDTAEMLPDLDLNPGLRDDANVVDTGNGAAPVIDMGAFERQTPSAPAGITVNPTSGLVTTEDGGSATFTVVLDRYPGADVSIPLSSSDSTEGAVAPASLLFTQANWNAAQTVTVTGVDDGIADGDQVYSIVVGAATSTDAQYSGLDATDVSVTNRAGVCDSYLFPYTLSGVDNPARVAELRQAVQCANTNATDDVIDLGGNTLVFDDGPYISANSAQALPVLAGVLTLRNGELQRDAAAATPRFRFIDSPTGTRLTLRNMAFRNGVQAGGGAIHSRGSLDVFESTFVANRSEAPSYQQDGGAIYSLGSGLRIRGSSFRENVARSGGAVYSSVDTTDIRDSRFERNQAATGGALLAESDLVVIGSSFVGNEAGHGGALGYTGGQVDVLNCRFKDNIATTGGGALSKVELTNDGDLRVANSLFEGNTASDGMVLYSLASAGTEQFTQVTITAHAPSGSATLFRRAGGTDDVAAIRNSVLWGNGGVGAGNVGIERSIVQGGFAGGSAILDLDPRFVDAANGDYTLDSASPAIDAGDNAFVPSDVFDVDEDAVTSEDAPDLAGSPRRHDDPNMADTGAGTAPLVDLGAYERQSGSLPVGIAVNPTSGLVTTEAGGTATFTVVLERAPMANVTLALSSSDTTEGIVAPALLTFTPANWNVAQTVTVTGVDDQIADGAMPYTIVTAPAASADANYEGLNAADVSATNTDDDVAGIAVSPSGGLVTTEAGGMATFTVVLSSEPTAAVTLPLSSSNANEGTVAPASLVFKSANWNVAQTVTVTGVDDMVADGDQVYSIVVGPASSTDVGYAGMDPADVSVTNTDDETAGITVSPTSGLVTTEAGGTATFTVVLNTQPTAAVTLPLSSSNTNEGTVSPASLVFTAANWNVAQTVTVTGVDDAVADGDQAYSIVVGPASSTDVGYAGMDPADVSVTNTDDETAGITISPAFGLVTTEAGGTATFTVVLNTQPTAAVTLPLSSSNTDEGTVSPASLVFTAANWNVAQTVTVTGVDDAVADGDQAYSIVVGPASSADASYSGMDPGDVSVTNTDNETPGITVSPTSGLVTTEAGGTATFTVVLNTQPTADVTLPLSSSNTDEGTVSPVSLVFTPANWNVAQTVAITGVDDTVADGDQAYAIAVGPASSADAGYDGMAAVDVSVINTDDEIVGIAVTPIAGLVTTEAGGTASFAVAMITQPTADVIIPLSSSNPGEGVVSPASLVFTAANWNAPQFVTITGVDDAVADGDQAYTITVGPASSADAGYDGMAAVVVSVVNADDDDDAAVVATPVPVDGRLALLAILLSLMVAGGAALRRRAGIPASRRLR